MERVLNERELSLKKKIFNLAKMEALVFSDPKLSAVYEQMAENGEERYGYHYNETIMNIIFNDYVLNSSKYLQKYKAAVPKKKKRRDKSGINTMKGQYSGKTAKDKKEKKEKEGKEKDMNEENEVSQPEQEDCIIQSDGNSYSVSCGGSFIKNTDSVEDGLATIKSWKESNKYYPNTWFISDHGNPSLIDDEGNILSETTTAGSAGGSAGYVGYATPHAWAKDKQPMKKAIYHGGNVLESGWLKGKKAKPVKSMKGSEIINENVNYLIQPDGFKKLYESLNPTNIVESNHDNLEAAKEEAKRISGEEGVVQHVNQKADDHYRVEDWYDSYETVVSYENGHELYEGAKSNKINEDMGNKITSVDQIKQLGRKLTKEDIPNLADEALYKIAITLANKLLPMRWDDLPDINSMWDYINKEGGMSFDQLKDSVKEAVNDRLAEEGMDLDMMQEKKHINEKAKSKDQQQFMGMVYAYKKGELDDDDVSQKVKDTAKNISLEDAKDFASTKHDEIDEAEKWGQKADVDKGKMHKVLNVPQDKDVEDEYSSGEQLAKDLIDKVGREEAAGMINFAANINSEHNIYDDAQDWLSKSSKDESVNENEEKPYIVEYVKDMDGEEPFTVNGIKWEFVWAKYPDGKVDIGVYRFGHDMVYAYSWFRENVLPQTPNNEVKEESMIDNNETSMKVKDDPTNLNSSGVEMGTQSTGDIAEEVDYENELQKFEQINENLSHIFEDKKTSSMVNKERIGSQNLKNFKSDMKKSSTAEIVKDLDKMEKENEKKSPTNDLIKYEELEKKSEKESFKNVGDSANLAGDEIPKRNATEEEKEDIDNMRYGMEDWEYDLGTGERFEKRMKDDMGDDMYKKRQEKLKVKSKMPMYNKDTQPVENEDEYDNKPEDRIIKNVNIVNENFIGKYIDDINKTRYVSFNLNETTKVNSVGENYRPLVLKGLGNKYIAQINKRNGVLKENDETSLLVEDYDFYVNDDINIVYMKKTNQLNENTKTKDNQEINESFNKFRHLAGYDPRVYNNLKK
ncbi:MAG: hypothetical protein ACOCVF_00175 [bacterium]